MRFKEDKGRRVLGVTIHAGSPKAEAFPRRQDLATSGTFLGNLG